MADSEMAREARNVSGFSRVVLAGTGRMLVRQGEEEALTVEADSSIIERVTSDVIDDTLVIGLRKGSWLRSLKHDQIRFHVTVRDLTALSLKGAGSIEADRLRSDRLELVLAGSGSVRVADMNVRELHVVLQGEGDVRLGGRAESQEVELSGAGDYEARELSSMTARVVVSGAGDASVDASDTLDATITGVGSVTCHGEATVFRRVTGVGKVVCAAAGSSRGDCKESER